MFLNYVNEAYVGKRGVEDAFKEFDKFRNKYIDKPISKDINKDPILEKFNKTVSNTFNFSSFSFYIDADVDTDNLYTMCNVGDGILVGVKEIQKQNFIVADKNGFRFADNTNVVAVVTMTKGMFVNKKYTNRELFSVILHEIGHSFQDGFVTKSSVYSHLLLVTTGVRNLLEGVVSVLNPLTIPSRVKSHLVSHSICTDAFRLLDERFSKSSSLLNKVTEPVFNMYKTVINSVPEPLQSMWSTIKQYTIDLPSTIFMWYYGYNGEKSSDAFVTFYGYGGEFSSMFRKGEIKYKNRTSTKLGNAIETMARQVHLLLFELTDEHPSTIARIREQLEFVDRELEQNHVSQKTRNELNKTRKRILIELEKVEDIVHENHGNSTLGNIFYGWVLSRHNGDIRNRVLGDDTYKKIDDTYRRMYTEG